MDWLNIHIPTVIRSPAYVGSSPAERGAWLSVMAYACEIECGGRIVGAARWKDRQWQQACGVTLREVRAADRLLAVDGDDVLVNGYPLEKQKQVVQARGVAKAGAMARWGKRDAQAMPSGNADPMPTGIGDGNAEGEGEGKGKENTPAAAAAVVGPAPAATPRPPVRRVQAVQPAAVLQAINVGDLRALVQAFGGNLTGDRPSEWARDLDGLSLQQVAVLFAWRRAEGQPIREPSGARKAREDWRSLTTEDRHAVAAVACTDLGIELPRRPQPIPEAVEPAI